MKDKVVLVTGGTGGIGQETARGLAAQGATVVITGRNRERGEAVARTLRDSTGNPEVSYLQVDLSSREEIERFASEFQQRYDRLDVLVNNAGGIFWERQTNPEGLELTFALNHLGYFHLTHRLLPLLVASAPARIINVSSDAHRMASLPLDDPQQEEGYSAWGTYSQSKLANILFTRELARRLEGTGVTTNTLHPGFVATDFGRGGGLIGRFLMPMAQLFAISPSAGAQTSIYLASSPEVAGVSGKYFANKQEKRAARPAYDDDAARRLWEQSEALLDLE